MKKTKILALVLCALAVLTFTACSDNQAVETDMTPKEIAQTIMESQTELPEMIQVTSNEEFTTWVTSYYAINSDYVLEGVIYYAEDAEVSEIAVLIMIDTKHGKAVQSALEGYIANRAELFGYYAPDQAAIAKKSIAVINGNYAALLICDDTSAAKTAFLSCFDKSNGPSGSGDSSTDKDNDNSSDSSDTDNDNSGNGDTSDNENGGSGNGNQTGGQTGNGNDGSGSTVIIREEYDHDAILKAYKSGDDSALSTKNKQILNAAKNAISQKITSGMNDYQKELAIHDYITTWSNFDWAVLGHGNVAEDSKTPYGVLINRNAMCHGFSLSFQLFMDMLDIECVTVYSTSSGSTPHSWNVVKIENDWYCVDTAWDSTSGHTYFNVTSQYLKNRGYRWDESSVPEAKGTKYAYNR